MKGLTPLMLGVFGTFAFSWLGLIVIPSAQIGHLDPQMDEEGADVYPAPTSGLVERGRRVYVANGCVYCHTQQVRPDYAASDLERKWGTRRSAPRDYIFDRPPLLGTMRLGPDLANVGKRAPVDDASAPPESTAPAPAAGAAPASGAAPATDAAPAAAAAPGQAPEAASTPVTASASAEKTTAAAPPAAAPASGGGAEAPSPAPAFAAPTADAAAGPITQVGPLGEPLQYTAAWHHRHLYDPRSINPYSVMPSFRFLYEKRRITGAPSADVVRFGEGGLVADGWEIVPSYDAKALVAYLMSLDQSHDLKEVKTSAPVSAAAPGKAVK
ncbi:hypothetical protein BH18VER1_BH18VER1_08840 [soil metagenome]